MIRIRTPSRLHFGLFSLPSEHAGPWLNQEGQPTLPRRHFGGVGLMIDKPGIELTVEQASQWSAEGPLAERALEFAHRFCASVGISACFRVHVVAYAPAHVGLGTGTQLGLAVGFAIASGLNNSMSCAAVADTLGRGRRSAIGIHGFDFGGFVIEGGKITQGEISPLLHREDFPEEWRILLVTPPEIQGAHGRREVVAFDVLADQEIDDRTTDVLCRLVLLGMLPALAQRDLQTFGEAAYDFNRRVGEMFRSVQGGIYAGPHVEAIVKALRSMGVHGAGQSSWGPTVFGIVDQRQAAELRDRLHREMDVEVIIASPCNHGAVLSTEY